MGQLIALRCPPARLSAALDAVWDAGDAALVLPEDGPEPEVLRVLETQAPSAVWDLRDDAAAAPTAYQGSSRPSRGVDDDVALVVATSGSTGTPKGVELTHAALRAATSASIDRLGCRPGERWVLALPVHHVAGVQVVLRARALGGEPMLATRPEELAEIASRSDDAPHVSLVPTQLLRLLDGGADLSRLGTILVGGGPAPDGLLERARAAGGRIVTSYGMTETCGGCVYDGVPLEGVEVAVTDGRIRVRGPVLFHGYRSARPGEKHFGGQDRVPDAEGWFTTGDVGRLVDGRLEVLGRADDVVVSGGENVPVQVVEAVLREAPGVADVAVTGRPDRRWGTAVTAVVVPRDPADPPTLDALRDHVGRTLPRSFAPRHLVVVAQLPRDAMGKLGRDALSRIAGG